MSNTTAALLDWGDATWSLERSMEREPPAAGGLPSALYGRAGAKDALCLEWKEDACGMLSSRRDVGLSAVLPRVTPGLGWSLEDNGSDDQNRLSV